MSSGRKPAKAFFGSDWERTFKSSVGYYLQSIIVELATLSPSRNGSEAPERLKPQNLLPAIQEAEKPFPIPNSWNWYRLGELCNYGSSTKAEPRNLNESTWVLDLEDIEKESSVLLAKIRFADRASLSTKSVFKKGDVLYSKLRPYLDKVIVADEDGVCTTEILPLSFQNEIDPNFLLLTLKLRSFLGYVNGVTKGMKMPRLGTKEGKLALIPLPSSAEQKKILSFLTDLESNSLKSEPYFNQTVEQRIFNLQNSQLKGSEIGTELDHQLTLVKELRQAYLREAMQGKLVPQDPTDEPAEILLEKIEKEKEKLVAAKRIKRDKPLPLIKPEEIPFEIPSNWTWCQLDNICEFTNGKAHEQYVSDIGKYVLVNSRFVSTAGKTALKYSSHLLTPLAKNDIAIVMSDVPTGRALGRCHQIEKDDTYTLNQRIGGIIAFQDINSKFLTFVLDRNEHFLNFDDGKKQTNLRKDQILSCPIPLPPLAEQERIVAKLEKLMKFCDELEANIKQGITNADRLLQTALKEALEPQLDQLNKKEIGQG